MKYVTMFILCIIASLFIQVNDVNSHEATEMIPEEAIRLRILANSNSEKDQAVKLIIRDQVSYYVTELVKDVDNILIARKMIHHHIDDINQVVNQTLRELGMEQANLTVFHRNVPFPEKMYGQYLYPEGLYEAILITIGEGKGDNWWCVLFPPLCFVEFSTEEIDEIEGADFTEQENDEEDKAEKPVVSFFFLDWLGL